MKYCLIYTLLLWSACVTAQQQLIDNVVAKVGSEYVLLSDVEDQFAYAKLQNPLVEESSKCEILKNIVVQKAIIYQAKLDSVEVSDQEVQTQLDLRFDYTLRQMNGDEEFFKEYYGASVNEMKERYREDQRQQILAERMQQKLINEVEITPKEVKDFFSSIPTDSLPFLDSEVELSELVIKPKPSEASKEKAKKKLEDILQKITSGEEKFEAMALEHSMDPGSGSRGGDLGFAKRGTYVPEFEATVYRLDKGQVSRVIESEFGYHIIKMIERRGNNIRAKHILIKPEILQEDIDNTIALLDSVKQLVEKDSLSFGQAVKKYGEEEAETYNNGGRMRNPKTGANTFETDDLDPDIYFEVIDLKVGDITKPMEFKTRTGEDQYRIIQLLDITKPHKANLGQDYDKLAKLAKENKKNQYFNRWLGDKMKSIYLKVDKQYEHCDLRTIAPPSVSGN